MRMGPDTEMDIYWEAVAEVLKFIAQRPDYLSATELLASWSLGGR